MSKSPTKTISEYRIRASILLKYLNSDDVTKANEAAERFKRLPQFANTSVEDILRQKEKLQRKHALTVVALEQSFNSWAELKQSFDALSFNNLSSGELPKVNLYPSRCSGFLNEWYGDYDSAKEALVERGGYLMPYKRQFFICGEDYIAALGLDPKDANWQRIDYDWAKPKEITAWKELYMALVNVENALKL